MAGHRDNLPNYYMQWGLDHEYLAVDAAELEEGILYSNTGNRQRSHFLDADGYQLRATPDGVYTQKDGRKVGLEVKCPQSLHDAPKPSTICQVQFQMHVWDFEHVTVVDWTYQGYRIWHVWPSSEYIFWAMPLLDKFVGYLKDDDEPPKLGKAPVPPEVEWKLKFEVLKDRHGRPTSRLRGT